MKFKIIYVFYHQYLLFLLQVALLKMGLRSMGEVNHLPNFFLQYLLVLMITGMKEKFWCKKYSKPRTFIQW